MFSDVSFYKKKQQIYTLTVMKALDTANEYFILYLLINNHKKKQVDPTETCS